ncbi:SDR family NAD(P)-dependent oxidoreductase [Nonomuraea fastidiosa]|uniref:SDR family NAD(P)-dependent oxidoreductase n=1 Tax=Nonomuraea fastidiosa TaxID=46173 RepID=UPI0036731E3A
MREFRAALVTGASGNLGQAFSHELAARGCDLILVTRREERLAALAGTLRAAHGVRVEVVAADLADDHGLRTVEELLSERPIDLLVNNAGRFDGVAPLAHQRAADEEQVIAVNVTATMRLTRAAVAGMVRRRRGGVLNVSSASAFEPAPGGATYAAGKAFLISFSQSVHGEVKWLGVAVTALCPGAVGSGMGKGSRRFGRVMEPAQVVRAGLRAVAQGKALCVPGLDYRIRASVARMAPGWARRMRYRSWGRRAAAALAAEQPAARKS